MDSALEEMLDAGLSEDELLNTPYVYESFVREETSALAAILLSTMKTENLELASKQCESESDNSLYSGFLLTTSTSVVLSLTFVMRHKLTRAAFNDLLSVIEAHCMRPNNCKTSINKAGRQGFQPGAFDNIFFQLVWP